MRRSGYWRCKDTSPLIGKGDDNAARAEVVPLSNHLSPEHKGEGLKILLLGPLPEFCGASLWGGEDQRGIIKDQKG